MPQERYFIGPGLRDKLRETITRVDGLMDRQGGVKAHVVHQELMGAGKGGKVFRICTFTGAWSKNTDKTVTFRGVTATPNTALATNLFASIGTAASSRNCAIAREGTAWYLIAAEC